MSDYCFRRGYAKTSADTTMGDDGLMNGGSVSKQDQFFGVLWKKHGSSHQGGSASKWAKRFFVVRDSFLLYFGEGEQRIYTKRRHFNLHPKGIVPLGNCDIRECPTEPSHPFAMSISGPGLEFPMIVATDTEYDRGKWMDVLLQATRITWSNAQLWDALVRQLENQGLQMAKEKQVYFDKLQLEATALHDEKLRTEELERLNEELEKEKSKMELLANELREEYEKMKMELEYTMEELKSVEETKQQLIKRTDELQKTLEVLECEKKMTLTRLKDRESLVLAPLQEQLDPTDLMFTTQRLHTDLQAIEMKMQSLLKDKADAEQQLQENQAKEKLLEEEKKAICEQADELKESIKDLAAQNAMTEVELKEEVYARIAAERRLQNAEQTLTRLEKIIQQQGTDGRDFEETRNEMMGDVKRLKGFFENLSTEAKLDSEKSVMVKNTIHARKSMVKRAKTMKFETLKRQRSRGKTARNSQCIWTIKG